MDYVYEDLVTGTGKYAGVRDILKGGSSCGYSLWVGDVGDDPLHGPGPGDFPKQGGPSFNRKTSAPASGRNMGVTPLGGGDGGGNMGGRFGGGGGVRVEEKEYGRSVLLIMDLCE